VRSPATAAFWHVDAFSSERYRGNAAAVVFDADPLSPRQMQDIAREMNLSETVFVQSPGDPAASYRARIFTPRSEIPFAGHPTVATAFAMLESGRSRPSDGVFFQECGIGLVPVEVGDLAGDRIFTMTQGRPEHRAGELGESLAAEMLGCRVQDLGPGPCEVVSTGLPWLIVPIRSLEAVRALRPELGLLERLCRDRDAVGASAFCEEAANPACRIRLRSFAPGEGVPEDPVCGSGNGATAAYIARHRSGAERRIAYSAEQGAEMERPGLVRVECLRDGDAWTIRVGGSAVKVMEGVLLL